ncbi:MAG: hypothetical protein WC506_00375 [Candidatus Micrarchaeia archaeon]
MDETEAPAPASTAEQYASDLESSDFEVRSRALTAIVGLGEEAMPPLIGRLKKPDQGVRQRAGYAIQMLYDKILEKKPDYKLPIDDVIELVKALCDPNYEIAKNTSATLAKMGPGTLEIALIPFAMEQVPVYGGETRYAAMLLGSYFPNMAKKSNGIPGHSLLRLAKTLESTADKGRASDIAGVFARIVKEFKVSGNKELEETFARMLQADGEKKDIVAAILKPVNITPVREGVAKIIKGIAEEEESRKPVPDSEKTSSHFARDLEHGDPVAAAKALDALLGQGENAIPAVIGLLASPNVQAQANAATIIGDGFAKNPDYRLDSGALENFVQAAFVGKDMDSAKDAAKVAAGIGSQMIEAMLFPLTLEKSPGYPNGNARYIDIFMEFLNSLPAEKNGDAPLDGEALARAANTLYKTNNAGAINDIAKALEAIGQKFRVSRGEQLEEAFLEIKLDNYVTKVAKLNLILEAPGFSEVKRGLVNTMGLSRHRRSASSAKIMDTRQKPVLK